MLQKILKFCLHTAFLTQLIYSLFFCCALYAAANSNWILLHQIQHQINKELQSNPVGVNTFGFFYKDSQNTEPETCFFLFVILNERNTIFYRISYRTILNSPPNRVYFDFFSETKI